MAVLLTPQSRISKTHKATLEVKARRHKTKKNVITQLATSKVLSVKGLPCI